MSGTVLEARAIITAEDRTKAAFDAIQTRMSALSRAAAEVGKHSNMAATAQNIGQVAAPIARATQSIRSYATAMNEAASASRNMAMSMHRAGEAIELNSRAAKRAQAIYAARSVASTAGMLATPFIAHGAYSAARAVGHTYREYDKERRFAKAVMGISDAEQAPLIAQAIHGGATTKYNDIKFLEAQRELAARGLKRDQILGIMPHAANLGQALDMELPVAVRQMEGAIFGFKKDISTVEKAAEAARQTADVQVKAAKISGMTPEDLSQVYKYGATPARMAGLSEHALLAFGAISKKANMGGDEAGVAFRAFVAATQSPTSGGKTALRAAGLRYADYQKSPDRLALAPFVGDVAERYGVRLGEGAQKALGKIFGDKSIISNPEKFTPAVVAALKESLGGKDAKSLKSIAGEANRYRAASMLGVDTNALMFDLMRALPGNLQLANALFGPKQGARIANAFGDPETFKKNLDELQNHSGGYAGKISEERMAGFDGAVSRFEGSVKNLETALGRSFDTPLTKGADALAQSIQKFAELPPAAHRASVELVAVAAAAITLSGGLKALSIANRLDGGPGVKSPGVLGIGAKLFGGLGLFKLGSDLWSPENVKKSMEAGQQAGEDADNLARKNLPWWLGPDAHSTLMNKMGIDGASGTWSKGRYKLNGSGKRQDFTLGSNGRFSYGGGFFSPGFSGGVGDASVAPQSVTPRPIGTLSDVPAGFHQDFTLGSSGFSRVGRLQPDSNVGHFTPPGPITATVTSPIPVTGSGEMSINVNVNASPELKADVAAMKKAVFDIKNSGGGGLTPTGHHPSSLGTSMPESGAGSNR